MSIFQKTFHLLADDGIQGIVGTEQDNVVGLHVRIGEVQAVAGVVFVEDILCIVLFIEECQRQR